MTIWRRAGSGLVAAAAVAAVVGLTGAPAMAMPATTTLHAKVTGGGSITAKSGKTVLADGAVSVTCSSSKATGSITNGTHSGAAPVTVGKTTKLSFTKCNGPLGPVTTKVETVKNGYKIRVDSKTHNGKTDGMIGPVKVAVSMTGCSFTVTGSAPGYYNNNTHQLVVTNKLPFKALKTAQLTISNVKSCPPSVVHNGQHPTYKSTYTVSRKVKITVS